MTDGVDGRGRMALLVVAAVAALQRIGLWLAYAPIPYGDTGSYFRAAAVLGRGSLDGYDGTRVPGYPAFVALLGETPEAVFAGQLVLGWAITLMLFLWAWRASRRPILGVIAAAGYTLVPGLFLFEANLLTETLTAFLLVGSFTLLHLLDRATSAPGRVAGAVALGLASGAAGLVRILFYPLAVWLIPFVWRAGGPGWRRRAVVLAGFVVPAFGLLLWWVGWVNATYGFLAPTTMGGYNLVQHAGVFFEYLPDEEAAIRDTYLRFREARIAERGDQTNTIWEAIPELTRVSGLGFYDLSRKLQRLSLDLIREHPDLYLKNVVEGWIGFWKAPVYWDPTSVGSGAMVSVLGPWADAGRAVAVAANVAFLGISFWLVVVGRRALRDTDRAWVAAAGFVWFTSIAQTIADHGDNPRFLIPLQAVVFLVVTLAAWRVLEWRTARAEGRR